MSAMDNSVLTVEDTWRAKLTLAVALAITFVWTISFIVDIFSTTYEPRTEITPLMLAVAGFCFSDGLSVHRKKKAAKEKAHHD